MWSKFSTYAIFLFPLLTTTVTKAETIVFNGAIVEDSCSPTSSNIECKHLTHAINKVKVTNEIDHLSTIKSKDVARMHISETTVESDMHKILVVNYH